MEEKVVNESQEQDYPKYYYLFSVTLMVDGKRKFLDIPVYSHKMVFPNRVVIYNFACNQIGINPENNDVYNSFAVVGVYKFESKEDYESYVNVSEETSEVEEDE